MKTLRDVTDDAVDSIADIVARVAFTHGMKAAYQVKLAIQQSIASLPYITDQQLFQFMEEESNGAESDEQDTSADEGTV